MQTPETLTFPKAMLITMRPYLLFLSGITGIAGIAAVPEASTTIVLLVSVASFLSYGFGQALTDCFQTDTDAISAPYRPLVQGAVSRKSILIASLAGLTLCSAIFAIGNPANLFFGAIAVAGLATYTWFKRHWWGGPWYNAWIVVVLCIMAYLTGTGDGVGALPSSLVPLLALVFFGYANFVLSGYFKDIEADRQTGYNTFLVVYGRNAASITSDILAVGATAALTVILLQSWSETPSVVHVAGSAGFALLGAVYAIRGQVLLHRNTRDEDAHTPIRYVVQSYVLYLSAAAVTFQPSWTLPLVLFYGAFLAVLAHRTERSQI
jgi:4-hydroxybenzoate polyprenyltransferase